MDPLTVAFTYREDFDLSHGLWELGAQLSYEACGSPRPIISIGLRDEAMEEDAVRFRDRATVPTPRVGERQ